MTSDKLVSYVRLKGKKGLMRLYGILKSEDHEGSFVAARYRQNMHKNRFVRIAEDWYDSFSRLSASFHIQGILVAPSYRRTDTPWKSCFIAA